MHLRLLFRHFLLFIALAACDDLPDEAVDPHLGSIQKTATADTLHARLARPSPPAVMLDTVGGIPLTVHYGAPSVRGRLIFGDLVPYDTLWRTGANEATTISFADPMLINQQPVPPGKYAVFTIPGAYKWTWILNTDYDQWGAYNYDPDRDILNTTVASRPSPEFVETMRIIVRDHELLLQWADIEVPLSVSALSNGH